MPPAGPHGGDGARVAAALGIDPAAVLDLSASMNPVAPDPGPAVARHLDALGRDPDPAEATAALAAAMGIDPGRLLLTNGGAEAIALVATETGPGWADACDFSLYRRHLPGLDPDGPRWSSDPHNPLGTLAGPDEGAYVWDEAFYPLATGRWTAGRRGFTLGSLTKLLACPGLRIGYVVCPDPDVRDRLAARQPRWSVNGLACAALPDLLATVDLTGWAAAVATLRLDLTRLLVSHGLDVRSGATANWVLVDGAPDLRARLLGQAVVVRDCTSFGLPGVHRVAVPSPADLPRLAAALEATGPAALRPTNHGRPSDSAVGDPAPGAPLAADRKGGGQEGPLARDSVVAPGGRGMAASGAAAESSGRSRVGPSRGPS